MAEVTVQGRESLQATIDDAAPGSTITIGESYEESADSWPVRVTKSLLLQSSQGNPITIPENSTAGFVLDLGGSNRPPGITLSNLFIDANSAAVGIRVQNARFCRLVGCLVEHATTHGFSLALRDAAPNSNVLFYCEAHDNAGNGFFLDNVAHSTSLVGCRAISNDGRGLWTKNTYGCGWIGGGMELNGKEAVFVDGSEVFSLYNAYVEGNAKQAESQVSVERSQTATIAGSYINGLRQDTTFGVRFDTSNNCSIRNCEYRGLDSLVANVASRNTDLHRNSHFALDDTPIITTDTGTKTRNRGVIEPTDLSQLDGSHTGELAINNGTTGPFGLAVWNGSSWVCMTSGECL